jgi:hypothetical protein
MFAAAQSDSSSSSNSGTLNHSFVSPVQITNYTFCRFDDTIGIFPEFIDGYNILILPTTGRYFEVRI